MVKHFLAIQQKKTPGQTCWEFATSVAAIFNWGQTTAKNIAQWESLWVKSQEIPESQYDDWQAT